MWSASRSLNALVWFVSHILFAAAADRNAIAALLNAPGGTLDYIWFVPRVSFGFSPLFLSWGLPKLVYTGRRSVLRPDTRRYFIR